MYSMKDGSLQQLMFVDEWISGYEDDSQTFCHHNLQICSEGKAQIRNVEFYHSGQEGWTDYSDPRYSVAFLNLGEVQPTRTHSIFPSNCLIIANMLFYVL